MIKMSKNLEKNARKMALVRTSDAIDDAITSINGEIISASGSRGEGGDKLLDALIAMKGALSAQWNEVNRRLREEDY
ncbi:MAG: hypothetical protein ACO32I_07880 [Candidatus Limnocylindrus sp.]